MKNEKLFSESFGSGLNLVLLHGWATHSGIWRSCVEKMAKEFCVTLIDLPGFGRSQAITDYSLEGLVEHVLAVAPPRAIWLGWSLGGLIATKIASLQPMRVEKLICVASSPKFIKEQNWPGMDSNILKKFASELQDDYAETLRRFLLLQFHGMTLHKELIKSLHKDIFIHGKPRLEALDAGLKFLETLDLRQELSDLCCPTLYLLGKLDALVPVRISNVLNNYSSSIQSTVFHKASHAPFLTHENDFIDEVRRFAHE